VPKESLISRIEAVGGYVNIFYNYQNIANSLIPTIDSKYGSSGFGKGMGVFVEHTSVNPNKALHIGHARNSCLGDSINRILRFSGYDVQVANYIDDTGTQVADSIVGFKFLGFPMEKEGVKFDHYCGDEVYVEVNKRYEQDPELKEKQSFVLSEIEKGDTEIANFSRDLVEKILKCQLQTLWRMGIFHDLLNYESHILKFKFWDVAFEELKKSGHAVYEEFGENAGCWVLKLRDLPEFKDMKNPDKILVRSDGTAVYTAKDIAYAMWKHGLLRKDFSYTPFIQQPNGSTLWRTTTDEGSKDHPRFGNVEKSIAVIDKRQSYTQDVVEIALGLISKQEKSYVHYSYDTVSLSKNTLEKLGIDVSSEQKKILQMSGRKGIFINADTVLDALAEKAYQETKKRNPEASESWLKSTADSIAVAALRYGLTKVDHNNEIVFDLEQSLKLEGDTGPYLQYTYARMHNLLEKVGDWNYVQATDLNKYEKKLIKDVVMFPYVVEESAKQLKPELICRYANDLAISFNNFYEQCPVLRAGNDSARKFRSSLVNAAMQTLGNSLYLMGIPTLEKM
jgi:arginyl-tRNA synthetase